MAEEWPVERLRADPRNREIFDPMEGQQFDDLVQSIHDLGVLQALLVEPDGLIIAGEQRWRAAKAAGRATVPVEVREPESDAQLIAIRVAENVQRRQLKPSEMMRAIRAIRAADLPAVDINSRDEAIARALKISRPYLAQLRNILERFPDVIPLMEAGQVPVAVAYQLARLSADDQRRVLELLRTDPNARLNFAAADELRKELARLNEDLAATEAALDKANEEHAAELERLEKAAAAAKDDAVKAALAKHQADLDERARKAAEAEARKARRTFEDLAAEVPGAELARIRGDFMKSLIEARGLLILKPEFFVHTLTVSDMATLDSYFTRHEEWRARVAKERARPLRLVPELAPADPEEATSGGA